MKAGKIITRIVKTSSEGEARALPRGHASAHLPVMPGARGHPRRVCAAPSSCPRRRASIRRVGAPFHRHARGDEHPSGARAPPHRHTHEDRHPSGAHAPTTIMPAQAGIHPVFSHHRTPRPSCPRTRASIRCSRTTRPTTIIPRAGGHPSGVLAHTPPTTVMPTHTGIHPVFSQTRPTTVMPTDRRASIRKCSRTHAPRPSCPRTRASIRCSRTYTPHDRHAHAHGHPSGAWAPFHRHARGGGHPSGTFTHIVRWVPASAGTTVDEHAKRQVGSRFRGNDG